MNEPNKYNMRDCVELTNKGTQHITNWLKSFSDGTIINVEDDEAYRKQDVDLIFTRILNGQPITKKIEIKVDRYSNTGNYFFETTSNIERDTEGCFMYTQCDLLFYYFIDIAELHIIEMPRAREWFINNRPSFKIAHANTQLFGEKSYKSLGRLVPIKKLKAGTGVTIVNLADYID